MRKFLTATALTAALALPLTACGGSDDDAGKGDSATTTTASSTTAPGATTTTAASSTTTASASTSSTTSAGDGLDLADGRHPVFVSGIDVAGRTLTFDLLQFLTGAEAVAAYQAETGETDTPPNDYWIVNENTKLRTAPVSASVSVQLVRLADDSDADLDPGTWDELPTYFAAMPGDEGHLAANPYWLTISGGQVTAIEEQYIP